MKDLEDRKNARESERFPEHLSEETQELRLPGAQQGVRELAPLSPEEIERAMQPQAAETADRYEPTVKEEAKRSSFGWKWKLGILAAAFLVSLGGGFLVAGYAYDTSAERQAEREKQEFEIANQQQAIASKQEELRLEKESLQREQEKLQAQRAELKAQAERIAGKNEQIEKEKSDSKLGGFIDKVTGKEAERKKTQEANEKERKEIAEKVDSLDMAISDAQATLRDVDEKLKTAAEMKREADALKAKAEAAYAENKDAIDATVYYIQIGIDMVRKLVRELERME